MATDVTLTRTTSNIYSELVLDFFTMPQLNDEKYITVCKLGFV